MLRFHDCAPCLVRQALDAARLAATDEQVQERVLRKVLAAFAEVSFTQYPARLSYLAHSIVKRETGCSDPYRPLKHFFNKASRRLYPRLKEIVRTSENSLEAAVKIAIAGNIIDFAIRDLETVNRTIEDTLEKPFAINHFREFREAVEKAKKILYIGDNAGETFFDRILIEKLPFEKLSYVVKGGPIINDATKEDAIFAGLPELVEVVDTGSDTPGTLLEACSPEFQERFQQADLVIAKGQANYETLQFCGKDIFFLLRVKCPIIARDTGRPIGSIVLQYKRAGQTF
ncbi:MAG: DUF89 family protein [Firmicutes bacterium]|nr:DUF89 family protein [Bacillota bacterium]